MWHHGRTSMCCRFNFKDMNLHFECSQECCSLNNCKRQEAPGRFLPTAGHAVKLSNQARAAQTGRKDECMWHKTFHHNNGLRHRHKTTSGFISTLCLSGSVAHSPELNPNIKILAHGHWLTFLVWPDVLLLWCFEVAGELCLYNE